MIPVFQTRYSAQTFGNCFEACVASILELPLTAVPDRAQFVNEDAWADLVQRTTRAGGDPGDLDLPEEYEQGETALRAWLGDRGLHWLDVYLGDDEGMLPEAAWLDACRGVLGDGYWIANTRTRPGATLHATVWRCDAVAHNPHRGWTGPLGPIEAATLLIAGDPAKLARVHDPLPDLGAALQAVA